MSAPRWVHVGRKYLGLTEVPGKVHNPVIVNWLASLRAWWREDETPWCGTFVAAVLRESGVAIAPQWYRARAWLDWGLRLHAPTLGCVVVFERAGGGHVGFVVGRDAAGRLMVLGGNQSNRVSIAPFDMSRVLGYRWPSSEPLSAEFSIPLLASNGQPSSTQEA
jgi:uncharacterized protein (TIGR02594 family)